jgi:hypothetical protein
MSSNVHALELGKAFKRVDAGLPAEADVEAAFRTIIRWAGDDPERPGRASHRQWINRSIQGNRWSGCPKPQPSSSLP